MSMSHRSWGSRRAVALRSFLTKLSVNATARQKAAGVIFRIADLGNLVLRLVAILSVVVHPTDADRHARRAIVGDLALIAVA